MTDVKKNPTDLSGVNAWRATVSDTSVSDNNPIQQHPASVDAYIRHNWSLIPIPPNTKGPATPGWNRKENALKSQNDLPVGYGIGLAHAYSGTMALDIDYWERAEEELKKHDICLKSLYEAPDAVTIKSGKPGHGKLLYAMPFNAALRSKKIIRDKITIFELRCATANNLTVQDVLPPSIHPETKLPYQWGGLGHWTRLPLIPQSLLNFWNELLNEEKQRNIETDTAVDTSWEEIKQALEYISSDCSREEWISLGMALHWAGSQTNNLDHAFQLWDEWSSLSQNKYPGTHSVLTQWKSFRTDKNSAIKLGTLFHMAKKEGWKRPDIDASALFSKIDKPVLAPLDILDGLRPKAPDMKMDLWPDILKKRSEELSESIGCDPIVPLFAGLAAVCGVVDSRIRLELMPGFKVPPVLWLMTIGQPADKKSPGSRPMLSPLRNIEAEDRPRYQKELLDWEGKEAAYASAKKAFLEWSASPEALISLDQAPHVPDMPPQPVPVKITVSDVTSQKLVRIASDRPRGLLCHLDEMNSWVRKVTDKTSGEDRSAWVVSYESEHYEMDRVGSGSIHCDNLAVSIYGNIQPEVFRQNLASLSADGLLQRFIPAILRGSKTKLGNPIPDDLTCAAEWENTLRSIYALPQQTYRLSDDAYQEFREFQKWYEEAKRDERIIDSGCEYMTAFGKLEGLAGRLILIFHIIESPFMIQVSKDIVQRVVSFIRGYVIPAYRYAFGEIGGLSINELDRWLIEYIAQISGESVKVDLSGIKRSARRVLANKTDYQKDQCVLESMSILEHAGWVAQIENELHKRKVTWVINPDLASMFKDYREKVIKAKQRHADYIYRYAYAKGYERKLVKGYTLEMDE